MHPAPRARARSRTLWSEKPAARRSAYPLGQCLDALPAWRPGTLSSRAARRPGAVNSGRARPRRTGCRVAWPSPSVPAGRTTPAETPSPVEATPVPAGAAPSGAVPAITMASPHELNSFRRAKLIGSLMQAEWSPDKAGLQAAASRHHHRRNSRQGEYPQNRFPHDLLLGFEAREESRPRWRQTRVLQPRLLALSCSKSRTARVLTARRAGGELSVISCELMRRWLRHRSLPFPGDGSALTPCFVSHGQAALG